MSANPSAKPAAKRPGQQRARRGEYKPRLATTTLSKLNCIIEKSVAGHDALEEILQWLERERSEAKLNMDKPRQARVGELVFAVAKLTAAIAVIERSAREARDAKVEEPKEEDQA